MVILGVGTIMIIIMVPGVAMKQLFFYLYTYYVI